MQVSRNELIAVIKQAFEGMGFEQGDYENAAEMIVWSELHGLGGLLSLSALLSNPESAENISVKDFSLLSGALWDLGQANCFQVADLALGTLRAQSHRNTDGVVSLTLTNVSQPQLIAKQLSENHGDDFAVGAIWSTYKRGDQVEVFRPDNEVLGIRYQQYVIPNKTTVIAENSLVLYANEARRVVSNHIALCLPDNVTPTIEIDSVHMLNHYETQISAGIPIEKSLWDNLIALGKNVLVESTERSRMGAGA